MGSQSQSQNFGEDARFVELLKPIKDLTQNFEVKCLTWYRNGPNFGHYPNFGHFFIRFLP
jgi:hypothetical protein